MIAESDVRSWRLAERTRLRSERLLQSVESRRAASIVLADHLRAFLNQHFTGAVGQVFSGYWPIKGEPNLRPTMVELYETGATVALPVVEVKAAPMIFRRWTPETQMIRGDWDIPVPPPTSEQVSPAIALAPLVGWDREGYRLGYGGGYFDRTLAYLKPRPFTIGIGWQSAQLATIHPQPHDIPLDVILTETGVQAIREIPW